MFLGIKGTWYEYGTIVKTFKNISSYSKPIRNPRWKNCKGKQIKTIGKQVINISWNVLQAIEDDIEKKVDRTW